MLTPAGGKLVRSPVTLGQLSYFDDVNSSAPYTRFDRSATF